IFAKHMPVPFLSLLIDDCIDNARDYNEGGARYNTSYIQGVGLGSITDSLSSLKYNVYDKKLISMDKMLDILKKDFAEEEEWQNKFMNHSPKYGNDNDYADDISLKVFDYFYSSVNGRKTTKGGVFRINMLPTTSHIYFGSVINALPNGRNAGEPLSEGISPSQGCDTNGPTSVIKSAAKIDQIKTGGTLLNQKFTPSFFEDDKGISSLTHLVRSYFKMDGHHIQFNVVNAETLRKAQKNPELYKDLIVRVAGYSDYFNDLTEELQNEIINRTEHKIL
ncbi:pyruvate formate lyase family protein, partial [Bacteroidota bacterium]